MSKMMDKIYAMMESYVVEADIDSQEEVEARNIKIFYDDLEIEGKQKVLEGIDASFDYVDVFTDDIIKRKIEEALAKKPLLVIDGEELVNLMGIDL